VKKEMRNRKKDKKDDTSKNLEERNERFSSIEG